MPNLTITAANVIPQSNTSIEHGKSLEAITIGAVVYLADDGRLGLADNNSATPAIKRPRGIALNTVAAANQPVSIARGGDLAFGAILIVGTDYYLSDAPGGICPRADVTTGESVALLGLAKTTSLLTIDIQIPGVTL